jgi:hypothetical protein
MVKFRRELLGILGLLLFADVDFLRRFVEKESQLFLQIDFADEKKD